MDDLVVMVRGFPTFYEAVKFVNKKRGLDFHLTPLPYLAGSKGLEPSASGVTGRRYNRLNYDPVEIMQTTQINETRAGFILTSW